MDMTNLIATLKQLKCTICDNILSIPPILIYDADDTTCGRCKNIVKTGQTPIRNRIFENIAKHLEFPCIYSQCEKLIPWKDVETHEKDCKFRTITCPIFDDYCNDQINVNELPEHVVERHGNNIYFENIVIKVGMYKSYPCIASVNNIIFLIYICSDKVLVTTAKPTNKKLSYSLHLSIDEKTPSVIYDNQPIEEFDERSHCFRCLVKRCQYKYHPFSLINRVPIENEVKVKIEEPSRSSSADKIKKASHARPPTFKNISLAATDFTKSYSSKNLQCSSQLIFTTPSSSLLIPNDSKNMNNTSEISSSKCTSLQNGEEASLPFHQSDKSDYIKSFFDGSRQGLNVNAPEFSISNDTKTKDSGNELTQEKMIKCTTFNLTHLQNLMGVSSSMIFTITIKSNETDSVYNSLIDSNDNYIPRSLLNTIDNSDMLRKALECPICTEYMRDSIFMCQRGHHICSKCKMVRTCPTCQGIIEDSRNFALENIAETASLCCNFKENGCEFRGNLATIYNHEKLCSKQKK